MPSMVWWTADSTRSVLRVMFRNISRLLIRALLSLRVVIRSMMFPESTKQFTRLDNLSFTASLLHGARILLQDLN